MDSQPGRVVSCFSKPAAAPFSHKVIFATLHGPIRQNIAPFAVTDTELCAPLVAALLSHSAGAKTQLAVVEGLNESVLASLLRTKGGPQRMVMAVAKPREYAASLQVRSQMFI